MTNIKTIGSTNHLVYPQEYFTPEDEDKMFEDNLNWCYGVDQHDNPIIFRLNMNIEKIEYDKETNKPKPRIGENARIKASENGKTMPAIWNYSDTSEKNFFCAEFPDNNKNFGRDGGVILISKIWPITGEDLEKAKATFSETFGREMPEAKVYECGYARVLNQGLPEDMSKKQKMKFSHTVETPIYGIGRLEMTTRKPTEKSLLYKLAKINPSFNGNLHKAKQHLNDFRKAVEVNTDIKNRLKQDPENPQLKQEKDQALKNINLFPGVEAMRAYMQGNRASAKIGEMINDVDGLLEIYNSSEKKDEVLEAQIIQQRLNIDKVAIEYGLADFKLRIIHPEGIIPIAFDVNEMSLKLQEIYDYYTKGGAYGGAFLRVRDNKGRSIPSLMMEFECRFLGSKISDAQSDIKFSMQKDAWGNIAKYINQGLTLEFVPFTLVRTPGRGTHGYSTIADLWISGNTPMRRIYKDEVTGQPKNTYVVGIRRRTKQQPDSAFIVNAIATGHDGEAPTEHTIDNKGGDSVKVRVR